MFIIHPFTFIMRAGWGGGGGLEGGAMANHDKMYSWGEGGRTDPCSSSHVKHVNCDAQGVQGGDRGYVEGDPHLPHMATCE